MFNKKYNKNNSQSSIKRGNCVDKAPRLVFILMQYLSNSTKQQILGRQCYLLPSPHHSLFKKLLESSDFIIVCRLP